LVQRAVCPHGRLIGNEILSGRIATAAVPEHRYRPEAETMYLKISHVPAALKINNSSKKRKA